MKTRRTFESAPADYTTNTEWLKSKGYSFDVRWDAAKELFIFEYEADENYYVACMNDLSDMRKAALSYEEKDALNTAIGAIKTLIEMGILK